VLFAGGYDCIILDQVSFPIPLLRLINRNVIFYCHHPDKLLCVERTSTLKKVYRLILDTIEEKTTGMARKILVNSEYTKEVYHEAFPSLTTPPDILYPCLREEAFELPKNHDHKKVIHTLLGIPESQKLPHIITSLNRYERKKNIGLAIRSFRAFLNYDKVNPNDFLLVIAGGYDDAVRENVEHYEELSTLAEGLTNVKFLRSISNEERLTLLQYTDVLTYTPENEHFGIVPVEAMYMGCTVLACNSGGPTESIVDGKTGFLLDADDVSKWGQKLHNIYFDTQNEKLLESMKRNAKQRVEEKFSFRAFGDQLAQFVLT
jgi:alpha-1,3/alpha-1,6-mannosyltransferase